MPNRRDILRILPWSFGVISLGGLMAYRSAFATEECHGAIHSGGETTAQERPSDGLPKNIKVMGVGSGGVRVVSDMMTCGLQGLEFVCADTDAKSLLECKVPSVVQMGVGLFGAARPCRGQEMAERSVDKVREALAGSDVLFITACLGLGTGSGASPVIARTGKEMGMLTVGVVTMPFDWEGQKRTTYAEQALDELEVHVDWLIVLHNDRLLEVLGDVLTHKEFTVHANNVMKDAVDGFAKLLNRRGDMDISLDEIVTVIGKSGHPKMDVLLVSARGWS